MRKLEGKLVESEIELCTRIQYGTQLKTLIMGRGKDSTALCKKYRGLTTVLANKRLPNSVLEKRLMVELGFIPMISAIYLADNQCLDTDYCFTEYRLLGNLLAQRHMTMKDFKEVAEEEGGGKMATGIYTAMRGERVSYKGLNTILAYFDRRLSVVLQLATRELFDAYVAAVRTIARDTGKYDTSVEELLVPYASSFYSWTRDEDNLEVAEVPELTVEGVLSNFDRVMFARTAKSMLSTDMFKEGLEKTVSGMPLTMFNQFSKMNLTALECIQNAVDRKVRYVVVMDHKVAQNFKSKARRGATSFEVTSLAGVMQAIATMYYGSEYAESMPASMRKVMDGVQTCRVAGLNTFCRWFKVRVMIIL